MDLIAKMRNRDGIYWKQKSKDMNSSFTYEPPVPFKCRWDNKSVKDFDDQGNDVVFSSKVFVDRPMAVGDKIMLGLIKDLKGPLPPPPEAKEIKKYNETSVTEPDGPPELDTEDWVLVAYLY